MYSSSGDKSQRWVDFKLETSSFLKPYTTETNATLKWLNKVHPRRCTRGDPLMIVNNTAFC